MVNVPGGSDDDVFDGFHCAWVSAAMLAEETTSGQIVQQLLVRVKNQLTPELPAPQEQ